MKKATKIIFLAISLAMTSTVFSLPRLSLADREFDFGRVEPLSKQTMVIELSNDGDSRLEIYRVRACCGATASISTDSIPPNSLATLTVSLGPMARPGKFRKKVTLTTNDPAAPVIEIPIVGEVAEAKIEARGDEAVIISLPDSVKLSEANQPSDNSPIAVSHSQEGEGSSFRLSLSLPVILLAGLVDGFNPCAFSIIIVLAGILAVGGRMRKARLAGGIAFCAASYATYMAMGLGLVSAIRAVSAFGLVVDVVFAVLAASLFVLAVLSFRDAANYRKKRIPAAITLQLPDRVKTMIRSVATSSWSGPAVVGTGLVCGILVTLLDSLCTGQVYVPVLALLAKEQHSFRALTLLALYNLAFIAPLVTVFILAAKGADSERMSRWSKRNVVPSKIMLGVIFAILGYLLWPDFAKYETAQTEPEASIESSGTARLKIADANPVNPVNSVKNENVNFAPVEHMSDDELSAGNEHLDALARNLNPSDEDLAEIVATIQDSSRDPNWRNYCLQIVPELIMNIGADDAKSDALWEVLEYALVQYDTVLPGTALLGIDRLNESGVLPDSDLIDQILAVAANSRTLPGNRVTALRLGAERNIADILPSARHWAASAADEHLQQAAITVLSDLGGNDDIILLQSLLPAKSRTISQAIGRAINAIKSRQE